MFLEPIISVKNLTKRYDKVEALNQISFDIQKGQAVAFLGPNGAGKSTFFSILATILNPCEGDIIVNGISIRNNKQKIRTFIGYVPQEIALYSSLNGLDNLNFWSEMYDIPSKDKFNRINQVVSEMSLNDVIKRKVETYSGGMKRRLNLAIGILNNPSILILDEPLSGVDSVSKSKIINMMIKLKSQGTTIIFSSHSIDEVEKICDSFIYLDNGQVKKVGSIEELQCIDSYNDIDENVIKV